MNRFGNKILSLLLFVPSSVLAAQTTTFICLSDPDRSYMALPDKKESGFNPPGLYLYKFALKKVSISKLSSNWEFKYLEPLSSIKIPSYWAPLDTISRTLSKSYFYVNDGFHLQFQTEKYPISFVVDETLGDMKLHLTGECQPLD